MLFRAQTQTFKGAGTGPTHSLRLHRRIGSKKKCVAPFDDRGPVAISTHLVTI